MELHSAGNVICEERFAHLYEDVMNQARIVSNVFDSKWYAWAWWSRFFI